MTMRDEALEMLRDLDLEEPQKMKIRSEVLGFAAAFDHAQRRLGWFGRLRLRTRRWTTNLFDRARGSKPAGRCTCWPTAHVDRCPSVG